MDEVKNYNCHNCNTIFNTQDWVKYEDYKKLELLVNKYKAAFEVLEESIHNG